MEPVTNIKYIDEDKVAIEAALDRWHGLLLWRKQILIAMVIGYTGWIITIFVTPEGSTLGSVSMTLTLAMIIADMILRRPLGKRERAAKQLINAYNRKMILPFYNEIRERLPEYHIHLNENGSVTLTDPSKKKEE